MKFKKPPRNTILLPGRTKPGEKAKPRSVMNDLSAIDDGIATGGISVPEPPATHPSRESKEGDLGETSTLLLKLSALPRDSFFGRN